MTHTPTPWTLNREKDKLGITRYFIESPQNGHVFLALFGRNGHEISTGTSKANAEFTVKAVNCHEELLEALEGLANAYSFLPEAVTGDGSWHSHAIAAISKAKGDRELLPHVTKESWLEHGYRSIALGRPDII